MSVRSFHPWNNALAQPYTPWLTSCFSARTIIIIIIIIIALGTRCAIAITCKRASPLATAKTWNCFCCVTYYYFVLTVVKIHSFVTQATCVLLFCRLRDVHLRSDRRRPLVFVCVTPHLFDFFDTVPNRATWPWPAEVHSATLTTAGILRSYCRTHGTAFDGCPLIIRIITRLPPSIAALSFSRPKASYWSEPTPSGLWTVLDDLLGGQYLLIGFLVFDRWSYVNSILSYHCVRSLWLTKTTKILSTFSNHQTLCLPNITILNLFLKNKLFCTSLWNSIQNTLCFYSMQHEGYYATG